LISEEEVPHLVSDERIKGFWQVVKEQVLVWPKLQVNI
jgi:hypothetical protein